MAERFFLIKIPDGVLPKDGKGHKFWTACLAAIPVDKVAISYCFEPYTRVHDLDGNILMQNFMPKE